VFAWKDDGGPDKVTVEVADLVCEGNNTSNHEGHAD